MYAVLEEYLETDKVKSLISQYESPHDTQSVYHELKNHARSSTVAQITEDQLLHYVTMARFPGSWCVTSYSFGLHWKEQISHYKRFKL